jgi:hypothetical protein
MHLRYGIRTGSQLLPGCDSAKVMCTSAAVQICSTRPSLANGRWWLVSGESGTANLFLAVCMGRFPRRNQRRPSVCVLAMASVPICICKSPLVLRRPPCSVARRAQMRCFGGDGHSRATARTNTHARA